nr:hypothetical protein Iba_chr10bCG1030 [Ipomoea batatas]GMD46164.1 hypothetical protein Iba_chr10eCG0670 [Ipomoea batatas]
MPPPLRTARWSVSDAGGIPQRSGTETVMVSFSCMPPLLAFSAETTSPPCSTTMSSTTSLNISTERQNPRIHSFLPMSRPFVAAISKSAPKHRT